MRKISKEELRHGTWFRKMMVVTVFLFIAMIAAGAAMQMAEWALSGGNGLAAWLVVFGIFAAAVAGCKAYWKPMVRYCRRKYLTVPVVSGLLDHSGYYKEQIVQMNTLEDVYRVTKGIKRDLT